MAPVRDIRTFFKPADKTVQRDTAQIESSTPRLWPSSRTEGYSGSANRSTPSPKTGPAVGTATDTRRTPTETTTAIPPANSQSSVNSGGSKKVILGGKPAILNSDSDSDSDPLEELDFGIKSSPPRKATPNTSRLANNFPRNVTTRSHPYGDDDGLRRPPPSSNTARSSLSRLVREAQKYAEAEQEIAAGKADLEKPMEPTRVENLAIDENVLAGVVDDHEGEDKAKRLYLAMQRTNALSSDCVFHFFRSTINIEPRDSPFPAQSLPGHGWVANFEDPWRRDQAFLSGFARQIFAHQTLPEELARWMVDQICSGRSNGLTGAYIQLLEAHPKYFETILTETELDNLFSNLGANIQCLGQKIEPSYETVRAAKKYLPPRLKEVLQLLGSAARWLLPESRKHALLILLHMCIDEGVTSDATTLQSVQGVIESLMRYIPDRDPMLNDIVQSLLSHISHPILQNMLVLSLPVTSPMTASFRRHLALAFFVYPTPLTFSLSDSNISPLIRNHIDNSRVINITRDTNYASLAASLSLLDIGIGPGPTAVPCQPPPVEGEKPSNFLRAEEIAFNKEVDALAQYIKLLGNRIVEAGAISDLTRLEAKDNIEKLSARLENAVRIGGRKKRDIFEAEFGSVPQESAREGVKRLFGKYVRLKSAQGPETPGVDGAGDGLVSTDVDSAMES